VDLAWRRALLFYHTRGACLVPKTHRTETMKIPVWICSLLLASAITVSGWTLHEVIALKVAVAEVKVSLVQMRLASQ
jgi:hypothetical protein